jgi:hypothetical protein
MPAVPKATLSQLNSDSFPNNNLGEITPADLRDFNTAMIASLVDEIPFGTYTASVATSLSALNTYTASQQPTYTALNSFTASQLTINTGVNTFTQSATGRLNNLENTTSSLNAWSSSINQILVNGVSIGTSTRFFFNGFVSASIVANVNGAIASITVLSDPSLTTTASFNAFTASIAGTNDWTASAKISITALNSQTASILTSITALNQFTASDNTSQAALNNFTASQNQLNATFATTGSNLFNGNQMISGTVSITSPNVDALAIYSGNVSVPNSNIYGNTISSNFVNLYNQYAGIGLALNQANSGSQYPQVGINVDSTQWPQDIFGGYQVQDPSLGYFTFFGLAANSYTPEYGGEVVGWFGGGANNANGSNTALIMRTGSANLEVFKPTVFNYPVSISGSTTITGSVLGNVSALSITSQTASMDLSQGNFFTLTLVSGSTTHLTATNIKEGQTINLLVTQAAAGSGSLSYNSTFKFNPGNQYTASANGSSQDILTFITFNNSTIYASAIKNLV